MSLWQTQRTGGIPAAILVPLSVSSCLPYWKGWLYCMAIIQEEPTFYQALLIPWRDAPSPLLGSQTEVKLY